MPKAVISGFNLDLKSCLLTLFVMPVFVYLLLIFRKYVKEWSSYIVEGVLYWITRSIKQSFAGKLSLSRYCKLKVGDDLRYLYVPSSLDIKLDIDKVFVPLTLEEQVTNDTKYDHSNILSVGNRIRVIGDPGSGKSSLVKKLYRDCLFLGIKKPSEARLPIFIELKNLEVPNKTKDLGSWFYNKIRSEIDKSKIYRMTECFDSYALNQGILILLDGLDEVSTSNYPRVQRAIDGLSDKLIQLSASNSIIITMRTQFHQQVKHAFSTKFGNALFLNSFSPSDIYTYLTKWPFKDKSDRHIARIYKELTDRPTLREMCSNPLILSMYIAEDQALGHVVAPESRTDFYKKITDELIIRRRLYQTGPTIAHTKLKEQRERILGRLAYDHMLDYKQSTNTLLLSDAHKIAVDIIKCDKNEAIDLINEIAKETGLISEEIPGQTIRFIHLTFCEFLAAYEAIDGQSDGWSKLITIHTQLIKKNEPYLKTRLLEIIPFACGLLPRIRRAAAISSVAALKDNDLLCRCFLETKYYDHDCWPVFVENQKNYLLNVPEEKWDEQWLRNLHLFNVVINDACQCSIHMPSIIIPVDLQQFYQELVNSQQESLSKLLAAYAKQDAAAVFRLAEISNLDLANNFSSIIIDNCDQAPFYALIKQQALIDTDRIELWASLLTEAALRSIIVAKWMNSEPPNDILNSIINKIPIKKRWYKTCHPFNTLYTQCLTIAINSKLESYTMMKFMRLIPPPNSINIYWNTPSWLYMVGIVTPIIILLSYIKSNKSFNIIDILNSSNFMSLYLVSIIYVTGINMYLSKKVTTLWYKRIMKFYIFIFNIARTPYNSSTLVLYDNKFNKSISVTCFNQFANQKLKSAVLKIQQIINDISQKGDKSET